MTTATIISVVIPCYNCARFVAETIESVLAQGYPNLEIIAVDDGSTDDSAQIVAQYPGVTCIFQDNAGVAAARNNGFLHSTGEYIVFLDHDDRLMPGALNSNLQCLLDEPDCAFSFGDFRAINAAGAPLTEAECLKTYLVSNRSICTYDGKEHYLPLLRGCYIGTPGQVMFKRSAVEKVSGFDTSIGPATDIDIMYRITRDAHVCYSKALVLEKRLHDKNQTDYDLAGCIASMMRVFLRQRRCISQQPEHMNALRLSLRWFEDYWAKLLIYQMLSNIRHCTNWRQTWTDMLTFVRYTPLWPARYICRKLRLRHILPVGLFRHTQ
jgi:glycosyltransferase involved in cell wall biosynthesis